MASEVRPGDTVTYHLLYREGDDRRNHEFQNLLRDLKEKNLPS